MGTKRYGTAAIIVLFSALFALSGCSFSESSGSISDSVSSPFKSSSNSSGGGEKKEKKEKQSEEDSYQNDVRDYTVAYLGSAGSAASAGTETFFQGLGRVAARHGITNWQQDQLTYVGIGRGLAKADVGSAEATAYAQTFSGGDPVHAGGIEAGFADGR